MPIAAIPRYMRANEAAPASPALRFGPHLPIWTTRKDQNDEFTSRAGNLPGLWTRNDAAARNAWRKVTKLTDDDRRRMNALAVRQSALRTSVAPPALLCLEARAIAPFTTGLGNEHPLENGFAFLNPYGLPYLPGSGVKGAVRRAAEELTHADFFGASGERTLPDVWRLFGFEPWPRPKDKVNRQSWKEWVDGFPVGKAEIDSYLDAALQYDPAAREKLRQRLDAQHDDVHRLLALLEDRTLHVRGALDFWDVIPKIAGDGLAVEIMTPHQSHYYQDNPHQGSTTPHDSGSPTPISFLTVPAESEFTFHIRCDVARLQRIAPRLARNGRWKHLVEAAFEHAFSWLGFGAKTAAGSMVRCNVTGNGKTGSVATTPIMRAASRSNGKTGRRRSETPGSAKNGWRHWTRSTGTFRRCSTPVPTRACRKSPRSFRRSRRTDGTEPPRWRLQSG